MAFHSRWTRPSIPALNFGYRWQDPHWQNTFTCLFPVGVPHGDCIPMRIGVAFICLVSRGTWICLLHLIALQACRFQRQQPDVASQLVSMFCQFRPWRAWTVYTNECVNKHVAKISSTALLSYSKTNRHIHMSSSVSGKTILLTKLPTLFLALFQVSLSLFRGTFQTLLAYWLSWLNHKKP